MNSPSRRDSTLPVREAAALAKKWEIVTAATSLFARHGFVATSMDDIAEAAQFTKRTVYRHMASKDGVLLAIHERMVQLTSEALESSGARTSPSATEALAGHMHAHVAVITEYSTEATVFLEQMKYLSADLRDQVVARRDEYEDSFREVIARGIDTGEFRESTPQAVTQLLLGALNYMYRWYRPDGPLSPEQIADVAINLVLYGLHGFTNGVLEHSRRRSAFDDVRQKVERLLPEESEPTSSKFNAVVDTATGLFAERGFHGTSAIDLALAANLGKGALYYHIDGKASLLAAVLRRAMTASETSLAGVIRTTASDDDVLRAVIIEQCRDISRRQAAVRVTLEESRYLPPEDAAQMILRQRVFQELLSEIITAGAGANRLTPAELQVVTSLELGAVVFISRWFSPSGPRSIEEVGGDFADILEHGIARDRAAR